jgi:hypothetical protein
MGHANGVGKHMMSLGIPEILRGWFKMEFSKIKVDFTFTNVENMEKQK